MPRARASLAWVSSPRSCLRFLSTTCFRSVEPFACAARSTRATRRALLLIVLGSCCACFAPPQPIRTSQRCPTENVTTPLVPCGHNCLRRRVHNPSDGGSWVRLCEGEIRLSSVSPPFDVDFLALKRPSEPVEFDHGMACGSASNDGGTHARSPSEVAYVRRRVGGPSLPDASKGASLVGSQRRNCHLRDPGAQRCLHPIPIEQAGMMQNPCEITTDRTTSRHNGAVLAHSTRNSNLSDQPASRHARVGRSHGIRERREV